MILEIDPATERQIREQAKRRGMDAERFAAILLRILVRTATDPSDRRIPSYLTATDEEWEAELDRWIVDDGNAAPPIPDEALRREQMYEDRG